MKQLFASITFLALAACGLHAQATSTTVCDVVKNPAAFDGKMVTIKGTVVAGFDQFVIKDGECGKEVDSIWLAYPQGSKAKAGPVAMVELSPAKNFGGTATAASRAAVTLTKDKEFKQFDAALSASHSNGTMCLGCNRYSVQATITGRLDGVQDAAIKRDGSKITGLGGFGNVNQYPARLVIASVADVATKDVDYSTSDGLAKQIQKQTDQSGASGQQGAPGQAATQTSTLSFTDAKAAADKLVAAMAPGALTVQLQKDLNLIPKPKEQNGVVIENGTANEVPANEGAAGAVDSPDGVIYTCTFNRDKLPGGALQIAMIHAAQHVADVRSPMPGNEQAPMAILENNAWAVTTTLGVFGGEKAITASGGAVLWNSSWPEADKVSTMQSALATFLAKEEQLSR